MTENDFFAWGEPPAEAEDEVVDAEFTTEPEPLPPMVISDTRVAYQKLEQFKQGVEMLRVDAKAVTLIRDEATAKSATEMATTAKKRFNELETIRHHFVDPLFKAKKEIDTWFKELTEPLQAIEKHLGRQLGNFDQFQRTERARIAAEQEAAAKKIREDQEREAAKAKEKGVEYDVAPLPPAVTPPATKVIRTAGGSASFRAKQITVVEDENLIPEEYWTRTLNMEKITQDLKAGVTIPGAKLEDEPITNIRV